MYTVQVQCLIDIKQGALDGARAPSAMTYRPQQHLQQLPRDHTNHAVGIIL